MEGEDALQRAADLEARLEADCIRTGTAVKIEHHDRDGAHVASQVKTVAGRVTEVELIPVQGAPVAEEGHDPRLPVGGGGLRAGSGW